MQSAKTAILLPGLAVLSVVACATSHAAGDQNSVEEFSDARITLEQNYTDQDTEVVVVAKGLDDGLRTLTVSTPDGTQILNLAAKASTLGVREFSIESPEPGLAEVLEAYPEGVYLFEGITTGGVRLRSTAVLSHRLLGPTTIGLDQNGQAINWSSVSNADHYVVELEREVDDKDVAKLILEVPAEVTSFAIPATMRAAGDYQVGIGAVSRSGNKTVAEMNFAIDDQGRANAARNPP